MLWFRRDADRRGLVLEPRELALQLGNIGIEPVEIGLWRAGVIVAQLVEPVDLVLDDLRDLRDLSFALGGAEMVQEPQLEQQRQTGEITEGPFEPRLQQAGQGGASA